MRAANSEPGPTLSSSALTRPADPGRPWLLRTSLRSLLKEVTAFVVVGGACLVIDLGLFQLLYSSAGFGAVSARVASTVVSMTVSYFANRSWSFSHRARTGVKREYVLFAVINGLTLFLSLGIVAFVRYPLHQDNALVLQAANVASVAISTVLRCLSYRQSVFIRPDHQAALVPVTVTAPSPC